MSKTPLRIDINCDIGEEERTGPGLTPSEKTLLSFLTSVNIACGFHAGTPETMQTLVRAAAERGIGIGAHVSLPDREGFGRREMPMRPSDIYAITLYQICALSAFAAAAGAPHSHVKPHGALYHMAEKDEETARAIAKAVQDSAPDAWIVGLSGGRLVRIAGEMGLKAAHEVFADRVYLSAGDLAPRDMPGALITDHEMAVRRMLGLLQTGEMEAQGGERLHLRADTICLHSDSPGAANLAAALWARLTKAGIQPTWLGSA